MGDKLPNGLAALERFEIVEIDNTGKAIDFEGRHVHIWSWLSQHKIYPKSITVSTISDELLEYLAEHDSLISLHIRNDNLAFGEVSPNHRQQQKELQDAHYLITHFPDILFEIYWRLHEYIIPDNSKTLQHLTLRVHAVIGPDDKADLQSMVLLSEISSLEDVLPYDRITYHYDGFKTLMNTISVCSVLSKVELLSEYPTEWPARRSIPLQKSDPEVDIAKIEDFVISWRPESDENVADMEWNDGLTLNIKWEPDETKHSDLPCRSEFVLKNYSGGGWRFTQTQKFANLNKGSLSPRDDNV